MKYVCEYSIPLDNQENRQYTVSAVNKASYIIKKINEYGVKVEIVSPTSTKLNNGFFRKRIDKINKYCILVSGSTFGAKLKIIKYTQRIWQLVWLFFYLFKNCKRKEKIFVYHSVFYSPVILLLLKLKKIEYILEVEEIFFKLEKIKSNSWRYKLEKALLKNAIAYIFVSNNIENEFNCKRKPFIIISGSYNVNSQLGKLYKDGKVHLLYAGLIKNDGVITNILELTKYLSNNYVLHIIGYGDKKDTEMVRDKIDILKNVIKCKIQYDGLLSGDDYTRYVQQCHIGICPLKEDKIFQSGCFPSKITSYLSNGLKVVTTKNYVLQNSIYGNNLIFSVSNSPKNLKEAIEKAQNYNQDDSKILIKKLDLNVTLEMEVFLKKLGIIGDRK